MVILLAILNDVTTVTTTKNIQQVYSKEPKSVTVFDLFTFFRTDLIQSETSWKLSLTSDWLMSA